MDYKWSTKWIIIATLFLLKDTESHPRYQENYIEEDKFLPNFVTLGQKYSIALGSTVVMPCKINETEHSSQYVLAWKRDRAVLTAGIIKVTVNPRIRLIPPQEMQNNEPHTSSYNLEIKDVRLTDAGEYACQIGSMEPKEIVHTLEVLVPPKIDTVNPSTRVDVSKGASIVLECQAQGNPPPKIVWSRKNNVMPNGEPNITSTVLEMMHADRHTVGHYRCTADNRVGQPDTKDIFVNVLYSPEIEVDRPFVHTGVGFEAQLICIVHAEPLPHVIWYKDTTQLGTTEQHSQQNRGNRYSLIIRNVTYNDLGNYTCQASNNLGKDRAYLTLSGIPTVCVFDSPTLSNYRDQYNISWSVQSNSPIREYRLFYRKQMGLRSQHHHDKLDNHVGPHFYGSGGTSYMGGVGGGGSTLSGGVGSSGIGGYSSNGGGIIGGSTNSGSGIHHEHEQWENIVIPEIYPTYNYGMGHSHTTYGGGYGGGVGSGGMGVLSGGIYRGHSGTITNQNSVIGDAMGGGGGGGRNGDGISISGSGSNELGPGGGANRNHNFRHRMSFLIRNLTPASNYEARVQARNDHGWNKLSSVFHFSTRAEDLELEPSAQPAVSKTAGVLDKDAFGSSSSTVPHQNNLNILKFSSSSYINNIVSMFIILCTFLSL